jgi:hypothetical protein
MLRPYYHRALGHRKVKPYKVHFGAGRGGIRAEPIPSVTTSPALSS